MSYVTRYFVLRKWSGLQGLRIYSNLWRLQRPKMKSSSHCCQSKEGVLEKTYAPSWVLTRENFLLVLTRSCHECHISRDSSFVLPGLVYKVWVYIQTFEICSDQKILCVIFRCKRIYSGKPNLVPQSFKLIFTGITESFIKTNSGKLIYFTVVCQLREIHFNQYSVTVKCCNMFKTCSKPIERSWLCK